MTHHLVGLTEIAAMLGVSRQRVHQLAQGADFPRPIADLASGRVWETVAVAQWISARPGGTSGAQESDNG